MSSVESGQSSPAQARFSAPTCLADPCKSSAIFWGWSQISLSKNHALATYTEPAPSPVVSCMCSRFLGLLCSKSSRSRESAEHLITCEQPSLGHVLPWLPWQTLCWDEAISNQSSRASFPTLRQVQQRGHAMEWAWRPCTWSWWCGHPEPLPSMVHDSETDYWGKHRQRPSILAVCHCRGEVQLRRACKNASSARLLGWTASRLDRLRRRRASSALAELVEMSDRDGWPAASCLLSGFVFLRVMRHSTSLTKIMGQ